jgi:Domain of unknown function (DUF4937
MFLKWITCSVVEGSRDAFSLAQQGWSAIAGQPGLVGQVGGWDTTTGDAHVLGVWTDRGSYELFMRDRHDVVASQSGQARTYRAVRTAIGEAIFTIDGDASSLPDAVARGVLLRVAECRVVAARRANFVGVQRQVWAPGMAAAGGMLGGVFTQLAEERYLVTTWWSDPAAHQRYASEDVPGLRELAGAEDDLTSLVGHVLLLEPRWRVLAAEPLA